MKKVYGGLDTAFFLANPLVGNGASAGIAGQSGVGRVNR